MIRPASQISAKRVRQQGFTLLEMAVVLAIAGIVSISLVVAFSAGLQKMQLNQTIAKMEAIQKALYEYRLAFNRLPCPADLTLAVNNLRFGVEAANQGACTGGTPAANFSQTPAVGPRDAREGMVPTKTLQLPDDMAFDGWGRRFVYAVSMDMTAPGAFATTNTYDASVRMSVKDAQGTVKSDIICQVLVSLGPNGHGAYTRVGSATRLNVASVNTSEQDNCDCNASAASTGFDGVFVQKDITLNPTNKLDSFDDIVMVSSRGDYLLPSSIQAQPFGTNAGGGGMTSNGSGSGGGGTVGGSGGLTGGGLCDGGFAKCNINGGIKRCLCAL